MTDFYTYKDTLAYQQQVKSQKKITLPSPFVYISNDQQVKKIADDILANGTPTAWGGDTETTGLCPRSDRVRLFQIAVPKKKVVVIDLFHVNDLTPLTPLFEGNSIKIFHNLKFDHAMLSASGIHIKPPFFCTMLGYQVYLGGRTGSSKLKTVVKELLQIDLNKEEQKSDFNQPILRASQLQYAADDAAILIPLATKLYRLLKNHDADHGSNLSFIAELESSIAPTIARIENWGIYLNQQKLESVLVGLKQEQRAHFLSFHKYLDIPLTQQISLLDNEGTISGINLASPQQVTQALKTTGLKIEKTGQRDIIRYVDKHPSIRSLIEWRKVAKNSSLMKQTFLPTVDPLTQRIHPTFFQVKARSGRFTCERPPLQTVPRIKAVRQCFQAAPGYTLIKADYSQIELRIIAKITEDPKLVHAYINGLDVHKITASAVLNIPYDQITPEQRRLGKEINFGFIYGMTAVRFQTETHLKSGIIYTHKEAIHFRKAYFETYKGINNYHNRLNYEIHSLNIRKANTLYGRTRYWKDVPKFNEYINFPTQGSSADITKLALLYFSEYINNEIRIIHVVHDEIVLEVLTELVEEVKSILVDCMLKPAVILAPIPVVVDCQVGPTWAG